MAKVPDVEIMWKGEAKRIPLDKVVRLAQTGIYNEQLYTEAKESIERFGVVEQDNTSLKDKLTRQNQFVAKLIDDDGFRNDIRSRWAALNTPEARADRAEREVQEMRRQHAGQSQVAATTSFVEKDVQAPLQALLQQYPKVSERELAGEFQLRTAKYGAVIQPKDYDAVRALIRDELPAFAAGLHESRTAEATALTTARENATLLKKRIAQGAQPMGRRVGPNDPAAPKRAPRTQDERMAAAVDEALAGL
jgi:hypothetical protein